MKKLFKSFHHVRSTGKEYIRGHEGISSFSLLFDETTDCTVTEQLAVHGCYISNTGELRCCYLNNSSTST